MSQGPAAAAPGTRLVWIIVGIVAALMVLTFAMFVARSKAAAQEIHSIGEGK